MRDYLVPVVIVTRRMLEMFRKKDKKPALEHNAGDKA